MVTISLCMIVKNEEDVLGRCLSSIRELTDEIIIVDTGSTDRTKEIASDYTEQIFDFQWRDDFSEARNYAFSKASMDYCLWLDADDILAEEDRRKFKDLKQSLTSKVDMVMMRYETGFDQDDNCTFWYYRERLIKNNHISLWQGAVHEVITPGGTVIYSEIAVKHKKIHSTDPDRNLNIYMKMIAEGKSLNAREQYYYARELYYHKSYQDAVEVFLTFLTREGAWLENKIEACTLLSQCYRAMDKKQDSLRILLKTLEYDCPRAEVCCEIGNDFMELEQYRIAVFWFQTALQCKLDIRKGGFILSECYDYIPSLQLCVCYDKLGQYQDAEKYNEAALHIRPGSAACLYNKKYFAGKRKI